MSQSLIVDIVCKCRNRPTSQSSILFVIVSIINTCEAIYLQRYDLPLFRECKSLSVVQRKSFSVANASCFSAEQGQENLLFPRSIWGRGQVFATRVLEKGILFFR